MATTIITRFTGKCADCGAELPVGSQARYYGRGIMYGTTCHERRVQTNGHAPNPPLDALRYHVTGAIERGEAVAITAVETITPPPVAPISVPPKAKRTKTRTAHKPTPVATPAAPESVIVTRRQGETPIITPYSKWCRPTLLIPGKDHRRTSGKATFSGRGLSSKCNSTAYWGKDIWTAHPDVIAAAQSIGTMLQAVGFKLGAWTRGSNPFVSYPARLLGEAYPHILKGSTDKRLRIANAA